MKVKVRVKLADLPDGTLFIDGDGVIGFKSEYQTPQGAIEAFIVGSGEMYWGGVKNEKEQRHRKVIPLGDDKWLREILAAHKEG